MLWFAVEGRAEGRVFWVGFRGRIGLSLAGNRSGTLSSLPRINSYQLSSPFPLKCTLISPPPRPES